MADTLQIPLPKPKSSGDFRELAAGFNKRLNFMGFVRDGKYMNVTDKPWTVVHSNGDSVAGKQTLLASVGYEICLS